MKQRSLPVLLAAALLLGAGCSTDQEKHTEEPSTGQTTPSGTSSKEDTLNPADYKGVGPVSSLTLGKVDPELAEKGKNLFQTACTACHRFETRAIGPALKGVTQRRSPEWIMNMILNPMEMTTKDPIAQQLMKEYKTQMTPTNLSEEEARAVLEYLRATDSKE